MTFIKWTIVLIMAFMVFLLPGCSRKKSEEMDVLTTYIDVNIIDENMESSRKKYVSDWQKKDIQMYYTKSYLDISDILDNEKEFLISNDFNTIIIYVYIIFDTGYEKCILGINYDEQETVDIDLEDNIKGIYVLCPEYINVEAITKVDSDSEGLSHVNNYDLYIVEKDSQGTVGGDLYYRIFDVDVETRGNVRFEICSTLTLDNPEVYGEFTIRFE